MSRSRRLIVAVIAAAIAFTGLASTARAGQWVQVSCVNPDGSSAPSQGWTPSSAGGPPAPLGYASTTCGAGLPMDVYLSSGTAAGSFEELTYNPPSGSTLAGGTANIDVYDGGYGSGPGDSVAAAAYSPAGIYPDDDLLYNCSTACTGSGGSYSTQLALPTGQGGFFNLQLVCGGTQGDTCDEGANAAGDVGTLDLTSADFVLMNESVPAASGFTGTILDPDASGPANLLFSATDPDGPGVYQVTADIDGTQVYSATPDTDGGACVPVGTDSSADDALEFDDAQPCPQTVSVDIPINTTALKNGRHDLTVSVTDAAGNTSPVEDTYITVDNAVVTPLPKVTRGVAKVRVQFVGGYLYSDGGELTRLESLAPKRKLPAGTRATLADSGPRHPKLRLATATGARITTLLKDLGAVSFFTGDRLAIRIAEPGKQAEVIRVTFRLARKPLVTAP